VEPPVVVPTPEPAPSLEPASGLAHEEAFADRGVHPDDVAWSGEGRTLNSVENAAADGFLAHAYQAEQQITPRMRELAQDTGGQLHGEEYSRKSEESFKRKLSDEIYRESPGHTLDQQLANMKDAVRYTVGFGSEHYTEGAQRVVDHLVTARDEHGQARYELVKFKNTWGTDEGYVGINSFWKDNATGQVFELQIHSEHSFAAKMETHGPYETARTTDDPVLKRQMEMEANARFAEVPRPEGAVNIRTPDEASTGGRPPEQPTQAGRPAGEQPTSGTPPGMLDRGVRPAEISEHQTPDGHEHRDEPDAHDQTPESAADDTAVPSPFVSDVEAVQIVRDHLHSTPAGYAFYPEGDRTLRFAEAVQPREGVVTLDLHGSPDGFHINGRVLSGEQFARAVEVMRQEGRIQVGEHQQIRLAACDIARGENSPAAQFARESGHPVTAPTERLWTNMRGEERVSSAVLRDGRWVPAEPENGRWRTFGPDGVERTPPEQPSTPTVGEQRPGRDTPRTTTGPPAEHGLPHDPTQARADHERSAPESHGDAAHEEAQREAPAHEEAQHEEAQHEAPTHAPAELSVETIEREYGVPERNQQRLQAFADEHGVVIDLRPTNPESVRWLDEGALPKPQSIKAKTISELDVMLGADPERVGLVGYFEPELPRRPEGMPEGEWGALEKRYNQRLTEFAELSGSMAKLEHAGQISVRDGVVYGKDESGGFRPITGDHDVFDIRRPDGQRLSGAEYDQLVQEMRARNMGVQHGAHMYWEPEGAFNTRIYQDIVERHQPGGEPLVRFGPGEQPHLVDATTPVEREPREAPHGESDIPASGDEFQARSGTDPPGGTQLAGADPRRLDELAAQATRSTLPEGVRGQAKAEAYVLADRLGLIGNEPAVVERRAALAEQLPERTRRFLEHPDLTEADRARVARVEARAEFEQGGGRVEEALRHAASLNELYEAGIRPHEIAQAATPENMRRVFPGLDEPGAHNLAELLHDPKVTQMLRESWGSPPYEPPLLAESVLRKLAEHPDLVKMMVDVPDLRNALAGRPMTLDHLATHQEAIDTLHRVVDEIHERGPEAVADEPVGDPPPTPLTQEQGRLSAEIHPKRGQDRQTGFEYRRRGDDTYRAEYLDRLYADAVPAQRELKTMAQEIAAQTNGEAGAREEPKDRRRAEDKVEGYKKNASRLNDLAAAKIAYDNLADLYHALDQVKSYPGAKIVMFDDRFARPQPSGYRDIQMSVRTSNGHVGEFRLHLKSMDEVAHWEHSLYEVRRDLRTLEKARPLTPTEVAIRNGLIREEQRLFWEALQPALPEGGS
jgi:hypothetical protein